jgi:hypothetical protein
MSLDVETRVESATSFLVPDDERVRISADAR